MRAIYKIVHTTCHTEWGGLERRIFNESMWMKKNGHAIIIAAPQDTPLFTRAKSEGIKVYPVDFKRLGIFKDFASLKRIFKNERPDIVNTHGNADSKLALLAAKKTGVPLRILSRHISAHVRRSWYNRIMYKRLSHYIFTTADYTTRHLQKTFRLSDMQVFSIPSGIAVPGALEDRDQARQAVAEQFGLDPATRFIGFVGRVSEDKGVVTLVKAFKKVAEKIPNTHLLIVGEGPREYLARLDKKAKALSIEQMVHFAGFQENVWPYYRALDCKVLPSLDINGVPFEGVPQAILEAMASGCPVIGSRTGGILDIISHETTGLLFDQNDDADLAHAILTCLRDPNTTRDRVTAAREKVLKHHTLDAMGRDVVRIYRLHQVRLNQNRPDHGRFDRGMYG